MNSLASLLVADTNLCSSKHGFQSLLDLIDNTIVPNSLKEKLANAKNESVAFCVCPHARVCLWNSTCAVG